MEEVEFINGFAAIQRKSFFDEFDGREFILKRFEDFGGVGDVDGGFFRKTFAVIRPKGELVLGALVDGDEGLRVVGHIKG